jgi:hypothetical protein
MKAQEESEKGDITQEVNTHFLGYGKTLILKTILTNAHPEIPIS